MNSRSGSGRSGSGRSGSGSEIYERLPDSGSHGDLISNSEDSDIYSQLDSLDRQVLIDYLNFPLAKTVNFSVLYIYFDVVIKLFLTRKLFLYENIYQGGRQARKSNKHHGSRHNKNRRKHGELTHLKNHRNN